ncbi:MAG TPA: tetratricopeptide repeat protein [Acidimicrobiales bacterium]|nr:tetratricopeptide repeat protein [Acidimicrobiales bacterium]
MHTLAVHSVAQLGDADVRQRFVVRTRELAQLLAHLGDGEPPGHALVVGARGMGKSLLLRRLVVAVADEPALAARWLPVVLPEDLYQVTSAGELWLSALGQVAATTGDSELAAQHRALLGEPDPSRLEELALQRLLDAGRRAGRKVLLLPENLDVLLGEQGGGADAWRLRQVLEAEHDLLLVGSAVTTFHQLDDAGRALFGVFHRIDLRPLGDDEVRAVWLAVTGVDLPVERAAAVRIVAGGNPRLVTVLGRFSRHPDLGDLQSALGLLIDGYTPYFKAMAEALPPAERKVFATLADRWVPATAAEVAAHARLTASQVSAQLARLVRRGVVDVVDDYGGKRRYELADRLYNLYHLLRRPDGRVRVEALVDLLTHLDGPEQLDAVMWPGVARWDDDPASELHRHLDAAAANEQGDVQEGLAAEEALLAGQLAELGAGHPDTLLTRQSIAFLLGLSGEWAEALRRYRAVLADQERTLGPDHPDTLVSRYGIAYCTAETGDPAGALQLYRQVAAGSERVLGPDHPDTLASRHEAAYYAGVTGDPAGALELYRDLARDSERVLGPDHPATLASHHQVASYTGRTGDVVGALEIEEDVLRRAAPSLDPGDRLLAASRRLRDDLRRRVLLEAGGPAPRELREVRHLLERRGVRR